ncbi:mitochondrial transcription factor 2 [Coemansia guatemalensis]|uniref:Mitochondrial transcription factor 2 n=1 Tax=Coemansia guatemalensis TaxID=2761395 RepID=A0A9W8I1A2_9FUNG|nr:mitochondrial transcription factor 2 [Coemansia guatemalensis]
MTQRQQPEEEQQTRYSTVAVLLLVATNAFPQLGVELSTLAAPTTSTEQQQKVADILAAHGGERFGEKDNTSDLGVLQPWLQQLVEERVGPGVFVELSASPSLGHLLEIVLRGHARHSDWSVRRLDLATAQGDNDDDWLASESLQDMLKRCWIADGQQAAAAVPSVLLVKGQTAVATLCDSATIDFSSVVNASTLEEERLALEAARAQSAQLTVLQCTISSDSSGSDRAEQPTSCHSIRQALDDLQQWLGSTKPEGLQRMEGPAIRSSELLTQLSAHMETWKQILARLESQHQTVQSTRRRLERHRTYVLRAFIVEHNGQFSVVRRFGKAKTSGHFSVLAADGVCRAVRAQDIGGVAVESMWVCSSDDSECITAAISAEKEEKALGVEPNGTSQTGINTVVADPDDEIFCQLCGDLESWSYNQIVLCDACELGVHQMCHDPVVTEDEVLQDEWFCGICRKDNDGGWVKRQRTE